MSWDSRQPRNRTKGGSSSPQGWNDPGWWDDAPAPAPAPRATSVRSGASQPLRRSSAATAALNGNGNGHSDGKVEKGDVLAARRTRSRGGLKARSASGMSSMKFALGFAVGIFGVFFLFFGVATAMGSAYDGKIMPGVHAGKVDLSGLTRQEAVAKLNSAYASLSQGKIVVTTPGGTGTISFADAGRGPDSEAMADLALAVGRGGDPISSTALTVKTFATGGSVPVIVKLDPMALEKKLHELTGDSIEPAKDASVALDGNSYRVVAGMNGRGIDEVSIARQLIDKLAAVDAPSTVNIGGKFVTIEPGVSEQDAQKAIEQAKSMAVDITLKLDDKTWTVKADTVRTWVIFGYRTDGTFGPVANPSAVANYVTTLSKQVTVPAVEPKVVYSSAGKPTGLTAGKAGRTLDVNGTAQSIMVYLDGLATGTPNGDGTIALNVTDVQPTINDPNLTGFVMISQVVTTYFPGESNGNGANIAIPAKLLNGQVIAAGQHFSFLKAVGPIDAAHGWRPGGVIKNGQSNHTGAMGGGICSASTTVFQAAAVAGLQVDERHAHFYWISRYALDKRVGLDATVYSNGYTTWDMRLTNDTPYPIVIRSWTAGSSRQARIVVQLWSLPNGRTVKFGGGTMTDVVKATDSKQYVGGASLPGGAKSYRREYPTNGFNTVVTRTVTDKDGVTIHSDTWSSHYSKVDGWLQIAGTKPPITPTPGPSTPHPATPTPTPTPTPATRRRKWYLTEE